MREPSEWTELDARLLRGWRLPDVPQEADKDVRGRVLVVAGSREIAGAALLAATASLRAGAGKLVIATAQSVAPQMSIAVPEARVIALPETAQGSFAMEGLALLESPARDADAALIGPGLVDERGTCDFVGALLPMLTHASVILDALAMNVMQGRGRMAQPVLLTPHAGEMAHLCGMTKESVTADPERAALDACARWNVMIALKGATTLIAAPSGHWRHAGGRPGLATSGSGDVLAGVITGLAAQQAPLEQACAWGVVLHSLAGASLARRMGPLGYLARELPGEVPAMMKKLQRSGRINRPDRAPTE